MSAALYSAIIFVLLSIVDINGYLNLGKENENVKIIFAFYYILLSVSGLIFMFYSLKFYTNSRLRTYAIFVVLGASKKTVMKIIFIEFFLILFISVICGTLLGYFLIRAGCLFFLLKGITIKLLVPDIFSNISVTISASVLMFLLNCAVFMIKFLRKNVTNVMLTGIRKEKAYYLMTAAAFGGVFLITKSFSQLNDPTFLDILISMALCLVGAYLIIKFGTGLIFQLFKKLFPGSYIKHLFMVNHLLYRHKQNVMILYITFLLNMMIIFFAGGLIIATTGKQDFALQYPYESVIIDYNDSIPAKNILQNTVRLSAYRGIITNTENNNDKILGIRQNDFNRLSRSRLNMKDNEVIILRQEVLDDDPFQGMRDKEYQIQFGRELHTFKLSKILYKNLFGIDIPKNDLLVILPQNIPINAPESSIYIAQHDIKLPVSDISQVEIFSRSIKETALKYNNIIVKIASYLLAGFTVICSLGILLLKFISDIPDQRTCFSLLRTLGMSEKIRKKTFLDEVKLFVLIPILLSNSMVWFYITAELKRVDQLNRSYIASFIVFQLSLIFIQFIFFLFMRQQIWKRIMQRGGKK